MKSGITDGIDTNEYAGTTPQWSPLVKSGITDYGPRDQLPSIRAAMEPAREERDHVMIPTVFPARSRSPQWSPLVKSGITRSS